MLSSFYIQNFKSIIDLNIDLSFIEGKAPNGYKNLDYYPFLADEKGNRFVPTLALYGANGSGKTNAIIALAFFKNILTNGIIGCYVPNKLNKKYNSTKFEIKFTLNQNIYCYSIEYDQEHISKEFLTKNKKNEILFKIDNNNINFKNITTSEYTSDRLKQIYLIECSDENKNQQLPFLTCLAKNYKLLNSEVFEVFKYLISKIEIYETNTIPISYGLDILAKNENTENLNEAFYRITEILKKLDIDITKMTMNRDYQIINNNLSQKIQTTPNNPFFYKQEGNKIFRDYIRTYHLDISGNEIDFNFKEESFGTQTLAGIIGICLSALENGKIVCIDELDRSLHSRLLIEIVRLFKDKRYNKTNAQLIFTAHNTDILDDDFMRVSEVGIINKNKIDGSTIKRLAEFKEIRNVTNFRKQYLEGSFSGIPFPYI